MMERDIFQLPNNCQLILNFIYFYTEYQIFIFILIIFI